ncbi:rhomboid family intramembrane serine protease [bacterium]|nr:rhomboid family intramembrane serine protease [bacterium]
MIPLKDDIPSSSFPFITVGILIINSLVFLFQISLGKHAEGFVAAYGAIPFEITNFADIPPLVPFPTFLTIFSSMFMHGGILHFVGNMLYLWIFGDNVEDAMGKFRFLIFYILCGAFASLAHMAVNPNSMTPMIGASGAISGVLGAYMLLYPRARVLTLITFFYFIRIVKLPALVLLSFWIFIQFMSGTLSLAGGAGHGGVAWFAHIGGFFAGMFLVSIFKKKRVRLGLFN